MNTTKFDTVARLFGSGMTRRDALRGLVAGAAAVAAGGTLLASEETAARKRKRRNRCAGRNWCVDRTHICGPAGGYGKCLVTASGNHICAELLFQVVSCDECGPANCTDCSCVPAAVLQSGDSTPPRSADDADSADRQPAASLVLE